eukprot:CAMPEP_0117438172 /NCGR_PEP_ID=MMETSP0759-20121206/1916_1 /TAXON_ID=63605 /ORGANISM="Percolomonas cosmopolitus, Strain WS" /LENGTH=723 /DNA_ID=CAMNT_0005229855 /DNA_START=2484 /DNA_END=4656 /DNA_ORIENTATION=+
MVHDSTCFLLSEGNLTIEAWKSTFASGHLLQCQDSHTCDHHNSILMLTPDQTVNLALNAFQESPSRNVNEFLAHYFSERSETPFFLSVNYAEDTFLVDCSPCRNGTIKELNRYLETFLSQQLADSISVPEIRLPGNVQFGSSRYLVSNVLKPFSSVICLSQLTFNKVHMALLEQSFSELTRKDFKDSLDKRVSLHPHKQGRAAIRFGVGRATRKTLVYSLQDLREQISGSTLDILLDEQGEWFMKVDFEKIPDLEDLFAFTVHIKSSTDKKASVWKAHLAPNSYGKLVYGSIEQLVDPDTDEEEFVDYRAEYKLPKVMERSGPEIDMTPPPTAQIHKSSGESVVDMYCGDGPKVNIAQAMFAREGRFTCYFTLTNCTFHNTSDEIIAILKTTMEYQDTTGKWQPLENVRIGEQYQSGWNTQFNWQEGGTNFNMLESSTTTLGIIGAVDVEGEPGSDNNARTRIPKSFPQPLKLRVTIHDKDSKTKSLIVEKSNPPKDVPTKQYLESNWKAKICDFVFCDDAEKDERLYFATYLSGRAAVLRISGTYYTWDSNYIKSLEYAAKDAKTTEQVQENLSTSNGSDTRQITLLFDAANEYRLYGLRVTLTTATSTITQEIPIPQANPEDYLMELRTDNKDIHSGKPITVFFDLKTDVHSSDKIVIGEEATKENTGEYLDKAYVFNEKKVQAGEVHVTPPVLEKGKKYVAKYISYESSQVIAWTKPFSI